MAVCLESNVLVKQQRLCGRGGSYTMEDTYCPYTSETRKETAFLHDIPTDFLAGDFPGGFVYNGGLLWLHRRAIGLPL